MDNLAMPRRTEQKTNLHHVELVKKIATCDQEELASVLEHTQNTMDTSNFYQQQWSRALERISFLIDAFQAQNEKTLYLGHCNTRKRNKFVPKYRMKANPVSLVLLKRLLEFAIFVLNLNSGIYFIGSFRVGNIIMLLNSPDLHIIHATIDLLLAVVNSPFSERINHSEVCALVDTLDVNDVVAMQQANIDDQLLAKLTRVEMEFVQENSSDDTIIRVENVHNVEQNPFSLFTKLITQYCVPSTQRHLLWTKVRAAFDCKTEEGRNVWNAIKLKALIMSGYSREARANKYDKLLTDVMDIYDKVPSSLCSIILNIALVFCRNSSSMWEILLPKENATMGIIYKQIFNMHAMVESERPDFEKILNLYDTTFFQLLQSLVSDANCITRLRETGCLMKLAHLLSLKKQGIEPLCCRLLEIYNLRKSNLDYYGVNMNEHSRGPVPLPEFVNEAKQLIIYLGAKSLPQASPSRTAPVLVDTILSNDELNLLLASLRVTTLSLKKFSNAEILSEIVQGQLFPTLLSFLYNSQFYQEQVFEHTTKFLSIVIENDRNIPFEKLAPITHYTVELIEHHLQHQFIIGSINLLSSLSLNDACKDTILSSSAFPKIISMLGTDTNICKLGHTVLTNIRASLGDCLKKFSALTEPVVSSILSSLQQFKAAFSQPDIRISEFGELTEQGLVIEDHFGIFCSILHQILVQNVAKCFVEKQGIRLLLEIRTLSFVAQRRNIFSDNFSMIFNFLSYPEVFNEMNNILLDLFSHFKLGDDAASKHNLALLSILLNEFVSIFSGSPNKMAWNNDNGKLWFKFAANIEPQLLLVYSRNVLQARKNMNEKAKRLRKKVDTVSANHFLLGRENIALTEIIRGFCALYSAMLRATQQSSNNYDLTHYRPPRTQVLLEDGIEIINNVSNSLLTIFDSTKTVTGTLDERCAYISTVFNHLDNIYQNVDLVGNSKVLITFLNCGLFDRVNDILVGLYEELFGLLQQKAIILHDATEKDVFHSPLSEVERIIHIITNFYRNLLDSQSSETKIDPEILGGIKKAILLSLSPILNNPSLILLPNYMIYNLFSVTLVACRFEKIKGKDKMETKHKEEVVPLLPELTHIAELVIITCVKLISKSSAFVPVAVDAFNILLEPNETRDTMAKSIVRALQELFEKQIAEETFYQVVADISQSIVRKLLFNEDLHKALQTTLANTLTNISKSEKEADKKDQDFLAAGIKLLSLHNPYMEVNVLAGFCRTLLQLQGQFTNIYPILNALGEVVRYNPQIAHKMISPDILQLIFSIKQNSCNAHQLLAGLKKIANGLCLHDGRLQIVFETEIRKKFKLLEHSGKVAVNALLRQTEELSGRNEIIFLEALKSTCYAIKNQCFLITEKKENALDKLKNYPQLLSILLSSLLDYIITYKPVNTDSLLSVKKRGERFNKIGAITPTLGIFEALKLVTEIIHSNICASILLEYRHNELQTYKFHTFPLVHYILDNIFVYPCSFLATSINKQQRNQFLQCNMAGYLLTELLSQNPKVVLDAVRQYAETVTEFNKVQILVHFLLVVANTGTQGFTMLMVKSGMVKTLVEDLINKINMRNQQADLLMRQALQILSLMMKTWQKNTPSHNNDSYEQKYKFDTNVFLTDCPFIENMNLLGIRKTSIFSFYTNPDILPEEDEEEQQQGEDNQQENESESDEYDDAVNHVFISRFRNHFRPLYYNGLMHINRSLNYNPITIRQEINFNNDMISFRSGADNMRIIRRNRIIPDQLPSQAAAQIEESASEILHANRPPTLVEEEQILTEPALPTSANSESTTNYPIDPSVLAQLPREIREEVIPLHIHSLLAISPNHDAVPTGFLEALPPEIQDEVLSAAHSQQNASNPHIFDFSPHYNRFGVLVNHESQNNNAIALLDTNSDLTGEPLITLRQVHMVLHLLYMDNTNQKGQQSFLIDILSYMVRHPQTRLFVLDSLISILEHHSTVSAATVSNLDLIVRSQYLGISKHHNTQDSVPEPVLARVLILIHELLTSQRILDIICEIPQTQQQTKEDQYPESKNFFKRITNLLYSPVFESEKLSAKLLRIIAKCSAHSFDALKQRTRETKRLIEALKKWEDENNAEKLRDTQRLIHVQKKEKEYMRMALKCFVDEKLCNHLFNNISTANKSKSADQAVNIFRCIPKLNPKCISIAGNLLISTVEKLSENVLGIVATVLASKDITLITFPNPAAVAINKLCRVMVSLSAIFNKHNEQYEQCVKQLENNGIEYLWNAIDGLLAEFGAVKHLGAQLSFLPLIEAYFAYEVLSNKTVHHNAPLVVDENIIILTPKSNSFKLPISKFIEKHKIFLNLILCHIPEALSKPLNLLLQYPKYIDFENKKAWFYHELGSSREHNSGMSFRHGGLCIKVKRENILSDSLKILIGSTVEQLCGNFFVIFDNEQGVDAGALTREWFIELSKKIFASQEHFTQPNKEKFLLQPNPAANNPEQLKFFKFVGRFIGMAVRHSHLLECYFTRPVYKQIVGITPSYHDLNYQDPVLYESLKIILENDVSDMGLERVFTTFDDSIELKPNGRNIIMNNENKREYVKLNVDYLFHKSIEIQLAALLDGFYEIVPKRVVSIFSEQQIELLICGLPTIDIEDWRQNTVYCGCTSTSIEIQWFWEIVASMTDEERALLLQFATGQAKVPLDGFKALQSHGGHLRKFQINATHAGDNLPTAHACANQLELPRYESKEKMREKLKYAISNCSNFGFV